MAATVNATVGTGFFDSAGSRTGYVALDHNLRTLQISNDMGSSAVTFATSGTERARIDSSGNLLVGRTSTNSGERLSVETGGASVNTAFFYFDTTDDRGVVVVKHAGASGATSRAQMRFENSSGSQVGSISSTGTATAYNTSSDYRLKQDIKPMTGALALVRKQRPVTYRWKADGSDGEGYIAHWLQEDGAGNCVTGTKDAVDAEGKPVYQGIDTSFMVPKLNAALNELADMFDALKAEFDAYKASHP
jgi:hypothetical protein